MVDSDRKLCPVRSLVSYRKVGPNSRLERDTGRYSFPGTCPAQTACRGEIKKAVISTNE